MECYPELVQIAKRENNKKRPYLLVNPLQGKHVPCSPCRSLALFDALAEKLFAAYPRERLLIIGFAETATAIGAAVAAYAPSRTYFLQTTREQVPDTESLFFSESHSHATEQKLIKNNLKAMLQATDRVVFVEDEVTTGNTILNIISAMEREYGRLRYAVASILNGMTDQALADFRQREISCLFLLQLSGREPDYVSYLSQYIYDPSLCRPRPERREEKDPGIARYVVGSYANSRLGVFMEEYLKACEALTEAVLCRMQAEGLSPEVSRGRSLLVLGAEEFMYPPLRLAATIEKTYRFQTVRFHAATRSPILPASGRDYPLSSRYSLRSIYDQERISFIYNLRAYDKVILLYDLAANPLPGLQDLTGALEENGCRDISVFEWNGR